MKKAILLLIAIIMIWFFLFGIRLIGYFSSINEKGLRATECGTNGCSDTILLLSTIWTFSFFIVIPLILPIAIVVYWRMKKQ
ncbi:hypothetical protein [Neobacillus sp. SAB-20_R2A]|uniref:hypothetical protein n=1 Tax=Neobacillus sp. SAB-20_R2A TaxID=3120519 RepID=UPI003C6E4361